jgi:hypothetical protein
VRWFGRFLLVLISVWLLVPGAFELVEESVHLAMHGDLAHDPLAGKGHTPFGQEDGCGGGFHLCSCCHSQFSENPGQIKIVAVTGGAQAPDTLHSFLLAWGFPSNPDQPPRS